MVRPESLVQSRDADGRFEALREHVVEPVSGTKRPSPRLACPDGLGVRKRSAQFLDRRFIVSPPGIEIPGDQQRRRQNRYPFHQRPRLPAPHGTWTATKDPGARIEMDIDEPERFDARANRDAPSLFERKLDDDNLTRR